MYQLNSNVIMNMSSMSDIRSMGKQIIHQPERRSNNILDRWLSTWGTVPPGVREDILGGTRTKRFFSSALDLYIRGA
jgi:hypothetical protein